jgi:hypothetical protein
MALYVAKNFFIISLNQKKLFDMARDYEVSGSPDRKALSRSKINYTIKGI